MTYHVPSNLKDVASFTNSSKPQFPDHIQYKCTDLLSDITPDLTYNGNEINHIELYFGVNDAETRERRNQENWTYTDENTGPDNSGPLLIDIEVYFIINGTHGKSVQTNMYTGEPAKYISTATYKELLREHAISAIQSTPEIDT
jgi:hypothetical protein